MARCARTRSIARAEARHRVQIARMKAKQLCRNSTNECDPRDATCLRCGAVVGERCRAMIMGLIPNEAARR